MGKKMLRNIQKKQVKIINNLYKATSKHKVSHKMIILIIKEDGMIYRLLGSSKVLISNFMNPITNSKFLRLNMSLLLKQDVKHQYQKNL